MILLNYNSALFLYLILKTKNKNKTRNTQKGTPKESPKQQNCKCCRIGLIVSLFMDGSEKWKAT